MPDKFFLSSVSDEFSYVRIELYHLLRRYGIEPVTMDYGLPAVSEAKDIVSRLKSIVNSVNNRVYVIGYSSGWGPDAPLPILFTWKELVSFLRPSSSSCFI